ncbi:MAG: hypothetical protein P4L33_12950 [Capsulimonadaceae bacterium]|nr:hypothetical protein [Capsulimonadaceae bacterium]
MTEDTILREDAAEVKQEYVTPSITSYSEQELLASMQAFGGSGSPAPIP